MPPRGKRSLETSELNSGAELLSWLQAENPVLNLRRVVMRGTQRRVVARAGDLGAGDLAGVFAGDLTGVFAGDLAAGRAVARGAAARGAAGRAAVPLGVGRGAAGRGIAGLAPAPRAAGAGRRRGARPGERRPRLLPGRTVPANSNSKVTAPAAAAR